MKINKRMREIEDELYDLSYLSGGKETPQILKLMEEYREEEAKLAALEEVDE